MAKYYALIRKADFIDLFKYGRYCLNWKTVVEAADASVPESDGAILLELFGNANSFESSFTYLVIKFESEKFSQSDPVVGIEDVTNVFPLDHEAKKEFEISFDKHIRIENPIWSDTYDKIRRLRTKEDCEKGAENVWRLFKPKGELGENRRIITEGILEEVVTELYDNRRPSGDLPLWVYLLRYERHAYYPSGTVGLFMDVVNVVCNYLGKREMDENAVNSTKICQFLNGLPKDYRFSQILKAMNASEDSKSFLSRVTEIEPRVDFLTTAVIFLMLKKRYGEGLRFEADFVSRLSPNGCFGLAAYLLGLVLGYDKTYDCLYENIPLRIYKGNGGKEHKKTGRGVLRDEKPAGHGQSSPSDLVEGLSENAKPSENQDIQMSLFPAEAATVVDEKSDQSEAPKFPCEMRKLNKDCKTLNKRLKSKRIDSLEEYRKWYDEGWRECKE